MNLKETITTTWVCPPTPDRSRDWHAHFAWQDADALSCEGWGEKEEDAIFDLLRNALEVDGCEQEAVLDFAYEGIKAFMYGPKTGSCMPTTKTE